MGWQLSGLSHPPVSVHIALGLWVYMAVPGSLLELEISIHILILVQQVLRPLRLLPSPTTEFHSAESSLKQRVRGGRLLVPGCLALK